MIEDIRLSRILANLVSLVAIICFVFSIINAAIFLMCCAIYLKVEYVD